MIETWQYNTSGYVTLYRSVAGLNPDADSAHVEYWEYDAQGRLLRYESRAGFQDLPENIETWQYDTAGDLTRHYNERNNGEVQFERWIYGEDGHLG